MLASMRFPLMLRRQADCIRNIDATAWILGCQKYVFFMLQFFLSSACAWVLSANACRFFSSSAFSTSRQRLTTGKCKPWDFWNQGGTIWSCKCRKKNLRISWCFLRSIESAGCFNKVFQGSGSWAAAPARANPRCNLRVKPSIML